jgi:hypothetical protein
MGRGVQPFGSELTLPGRASAGRRISYGDPQQRGVQGVVPLRPRQAELARWQRGVCPACQVGTVGSARCGDGGL